VRPTLIGLQSGHWKGASIKGKRYTEEQIAFALRQAESGVPAVEVCRKMGVSEKTFYAWKKKFGGMGVYELRRLRQFGVDNLSVAVLSWSACLCWCWHQLCQYVPFAIL
jgi:putative transposase